MAIWTEEFSKQVRRLCGTPAGKWGVRVPLRALGFAVYGLLAVALGLVVHPLQRLAWRLRGRAPDAHASQLRAQLAIHRATRIWLRFAEGIGEVRVRHTGTERLRQGPLLVVANHPSLIDSPLLTTCMPQADFVVSAEWSRNPFLRHAVRSAGYLHAERGPALVREAVARLRAGRSVVVYPEGSRTPPDGLRPFQRGVAHIALAAGCDVVPVVIRVRPRSLMKGQGLLDFSAETPEWHLEVGEPIRPADYREPGEGRSASARRLTAVLQDHFEKRWDIERRRHDEEAEKRWDRGSR